MSINSVNISGNLTRDPELRQTQGGTNVLSFGVAVNDRRKNGQTGQWEDYANFVDCTVFGARADSLSKILAKGMKVIVNGKLHYRSWEDGNGQKRSKLEVTVNDLDFMGRSGKSEGHSRGSNNNGGGYVGQGISGPQNGSPQGVEYYDSDVPF